MGREKSGRWCFASLPTRHWTRDSFLFLFFVLVFFAQEPHIPLRQGVVLANLYNQVDGRGVRGIGGRGCVGVP